MKNKECQLIKRCNVKMKCKKDERKNIALKMKQKRADSLHLEIDKIYDLAIQACDAKDQLKARNVIDKLKGLLNLQYKETSSGFYRLYDCCLQFVNDNRFDKARDILYELQQSWNVAVVINSNDAKNGKILRAMKTGINRKG